MSRVACLLHGHHVLLQGEVQTSVSVLLVLAARAPDLVDTTLQAQWYSAYIGNAEQRSSRK